MIKILTASAFAIVFVSPAHAALSCDKIRNILTRDNRVEILDFSNDSIVAAHNFSGSMTILCGSEKDIATDLTIGVNTNEPDRRDTRPPVVSESDLPERGDNDEQTDCSPSFTRVGNPFRRIPLRVLPAPASSTDI